MFIFGIPMTLLVLANLKSFPSDEQWKSIVLNGVQYGDSEFVLEDIYREYGIKPIGKGYERSGCYFNKVPDDAVYCKGFIVTRYGLIFTTSVEGMLIFDKDKKLTDFLIRRTTDAM